MEKAEAEKVQVVKAAEADAEVSSQSNTATHPASSVLARILSPFMLYCRWKCLACQAVVWFLCTQLHCDVIHGME